MRVRATLMAVESSLFSALRRSGRFITSVMMEPCLDSRRTGAAEAVCGALLMEEILSLASQLTRMRLARLFGALDKLGELAKMLQAVALATGVLPAGGRKNINLRAVQIFLLQAVRALALRELLVGGLAVEGHDTGSELAQFLGKDDAAFGKVLACEFLDTLGGALDEVGKANAEFDDAAVVRIIERLRHDAGFVERRPKLIAAPSIVMAGAYGGFAGIATNDYELHAFAEVVGERFHSGFTRVRSLEFTSL